MLMVKVGAWKNFDELEESLTLAELEKLISTITEQDQQDKIFMAGLQGVDLTKHLSNPVEDKRREIEKRAAEKLHGAKKVEQQEFVELDMEFEVDDD
jgi:hypothetical protein